MYLLMERVKSSLISLSDHVLNIEGGHGPTRRLISTYAGEPSIYEFAVGFSAQIKECRSEHIE